MSFPIRVLVVEGDAETASYLEAACGDATDGEVKTSVAATAEAARALLADGEFDLVVDDLGGSADTTLLRTIAGEHPGVPVIVLSGGHPPEVIDDLLAAARQEDIFGTDSPAPMVMLRPREELRECVDVIRTVLGSMAELANVELEAEPPLELETSEARALQIFARRTGAATVRATGLSGGLSGAKTVIVDTADEGGMQTGHVVGKLAPVGSIPGAIDGYEAAIPDLPAGLGAALAGAVTAGAGSVGAVFFRLADDFGRSWFECLGSDPADAAEAVGTLHGRFADRYDEAPVESVRIDELRAGVVEDADFEKAGVPVPDLSDLASRQVEVARGIQHSDLHGLNVLVSDSNAPLLIDYDNYGPANCALDPVTLELSAIFHRDEEAQRARQGWPSAGQAAGWHDLDAYLEGCPYPEAIRACRVWAEDAAASEEEVAATLMSVALRQLCFENTDKDLARALADAGRSRLT